MEDLNFGETGMVPFQYRINLTIYLYLTIAYSNYHSIQLRLKSRPETTPTQLMDARSQTAPLI